MFNVLQGIEWANGRQQLPVARIYDDHKPSQLTTDYLEALAKKPTIVIEEGAPLNGADAGFVKLSDFVLNGTTVEFSVTCEDGENSFPAKLLHEHRFRHGLSDSWNWHHTCWQLGEANIFETLYKDSSVGEGNRPKIFAVQRPPRIDTSKVACMMPFDSSFDDVYDTIKLASKDASKSCARVDEIYGNKAIMDDVIALIDQAGVVVCDLSGRNPNVLYETGIAHALGREVIIIAQNLNNDVPFDLRHIRCIEYNGSNQAGRDALREKLARTIDAIELD